VAAFSRLCLFCLLVLQGSPALGDEALDEVKDEETARNLIQRISREISALQQELGEARREQQSEQERLRSIDLSIQSTQLALRDLEASRAAHRSRLTELQQEQALYRAALDERRGELSHQLRTAYVLSRQSRLQLLLNQDDPARMSRSLAYYEYFNRAKMRQIGALRETLQTLADMQSSIDTELVRLNEVEQEQRAAMAALESQREAREAALAALASRIGTGSARLEELVRNRRDLETLLERLESALADIPADLGKGIDVAARKGRLEMPVSGKVLYAFGNRRAGGLNWQGWFITADRGTEVRPVAYGRVAYADWLRGYGLLLIIDHGNGFMSLYGHNETLFSDVGDWVEPGQSVALVGAGSGSGQGLYFELRKDGVALDPAAWLSR
jgi:septal ring factor EnvC (AmiA/AmiB activator)